MLPHEDAHTMRARPANGRVMSAVTMSLDQAGPAAHDT